MVLLATSVILLGGRNLTHDQVNVPLAAKMNYPQ